MATPAQSDSLPPASKPPALPSAGTLHSTKWPDVTVTVNSVTSGAGGLITVRWTITNHGHDSFSHRDLWDASAPGTGGGFNSMTITDHAAGQRYSVLSGHGCVCYKGDTGNNNGAVPAGGSQAVFSVYHLVPKPAKVDVQILNFGTLKNVPVKAS